MLAAVAAYATLVIRHAADSATLGTINARSIMNGIVGIMSDVVLTTYPFAARYVFFARLKERWANPRSFEYIMLNGKLTLHRWSARGAQAALSNDGSTGSTFADARSAQSSARIDLC